MIARVPHLISIEEIEEVQAKPARRPRAATTPKAAE
jgi:hypothetical protein